MQPFWCKNRTDDEKGKQGNMKLALWFQGQHPMWCDINFLSCRWPFHAKLLTFLYPHVSPIPTISIYFAKQYLDLNICVDGLIYWLIFHSNSWISINFHFFWHLARRWMQCTSRCHITLHIQKRSIRRVAN